MVEESLMYCTLDLSVVKKINQRGEFWNNYINDLCATFVSVISKEKWEYMLASNNLNSVDMRDNRYNQIIHLVSAANGAEDFYSTEVKLH